MVKNQPPLDVHNSHRRLLPPVSCRHETPSLFCTGDSDSDSGGPTHSKIRRQVSPPHRRQWRRGPRYAFSRHDIPPHATIRLQSAITRSRCIATLESPLHSSHWRQQTAVDRHSMAIRHTPRYASAASSHVDSAPQLCQPSDARLESGVSDRHAHAAVRSLLHIKNFSTALHQELFNCSTYQELLTTTQQ